MVCQHRRRLPLSSIDNNILRSSKRRKNAPLRSNETTEDEEHNNVMRATTVVDGNVEDEVAGQMPESSIELEQCNQHLEDDVVAQAMDESSIEPEAEAAPEEEIEVEEASAESLEVSDGDRQATNRAPEPPVEMRQSTRMEAPEESELEADDDKLLDAGMADLSTLNLRCKVSVDSLFPIARGKGKMRPPPNFLFEVGELLNWRAMTPQEQRASKALWLALSKDEKTRIKESIPGFDCICCKRKERRDASESLEVSGDRAANRAPEPPVEMRQSSRMEAPEESKLETDDDTLLDAGMADLSTLNLRCKVSVDSLFPITRGKGKMRPLPNFLLEVGELLDWRAMTPQEQRVSKALWLALSKDEKTRIKESIPGFDCICCKRKERRDRGQRRAGNGSATQCRSAQVASAGQDSVLEVESEEAATAFISLGSSEAERLATLPQKKAPYKRQSSFKSEYARSTQAQGGVQALKAMRASNRSFARALTATTVKPKRNNITGQDIFPDPTRHPRVFGLQIWVNQVAETPMSGGVLPASRLRREKPLITYVSTCPGDAKRVFDALEDSKINKEGYEKLKFFGSGKDLLDTMAKSDGESSAHRSRGSTGAVNLQESQDEIPQSWAPIANEAV
jgi:hypothetical protein